VTATIRARDVHPPGFRRTRRRPAAAGTIRLTLSRPAEDTLHVRVAGEIDTPTAGLLRRVALTELDPAPELVVLDVAQVVFFAAGAVTTLIDIQDTVERAGGRLCLPFPSRAVRRVLELVAVADRFGLYPASPPAESGCDVSGARGQAIPGVIGHPGAGAENPAPRVQRRPVFSLRRVEVLPSVPGHRRCRDARPCRRSRSSGDAQMKAGGGDAGDGASRRGATGHGW
jgi:anti-anti-sigma factor